MGHFAGYARLAALNDRILLVWVMFFKKKASVSKFAFNPDRLWNCLSPGRHWGSSRENSVLLLGGLMG